MSLLCVQTLFLHLKIFIPVFTPKTNRRETFSQSCVVWRSAYAKPASYKACPNQNQPSGWRLYCWLVLICLGRSQFIFCMYGIFILRKSMYIASGKVIFYHNCNYSWTDYRTGLTINYIYNSVLADCQFNYVTNLCIVLCATVTQIKYCW